jgi:hypothetical protein
MYPLRHTPNFKVILQTGDFVLIEDVGPWDQVPTITNQPEAVVEILTSSGKLQGHQRLFYIDSERVFGELIFETQHGFLNFAAKDDVVAKRCLGAWEQIEKHAKKGSG